jgi:hypothetical protein
MTVCTSLFGVKSATKKGYFIWNFKSVKKSGLQFGKHLFGLRLAVWSHKSNVPPPNKGKHNKSVYG